MNAPVRDRWISMLESAEAAEDELDLQTWAASNLGMGMLKQAHAFTLDFKSMTLRLQ